MALKSCAYCGRIHPRGYICDRRPKRKKYKDTDESKFRSTSAWTKKSISIRERDKYVCIYCLEIEHKITTSEIEVHHIIPVKDDYEKRLDDSNLISLCREHHEAAEEGKIKRELLLKLAEEQEKKIANDIVIF